jgi:hypothetical protein
VAGPFTHACRKDTDFSRNVVRSETKLIERFVKALRALPTPLPERRPRLQRSLQGNLSEFLVYDLGSDYWALFEKKWAWAANATTPWKKSSDPGLDILAIQNSQPLRLLVTEVKSSAISGSKLISGKSSTLKADFNGLFSSTAQGRLAMRIGAVLSDLELKMGRHDLVEPIKALVGTNPSSSPGVHLLGVLVCCLGASPQDQSRRERAFARLHRWLMRKGWTSAQIQLRTIEVSDVKKFLRKAIRRVVR